MITLVTPRTHGSVLDKPSEVTFEDLTWLVRLPGSSHGSWAR